MLNISLFLQKNKFLTILAIIAICTLSYGNCFNHSFLLDDYNLMLNKGELKDSNLSLTFFTQSFQGFYRPIGMIFLKLTCNIFQTNPIGYHCVNFILFNIIGVLFYIMLVNLLRDHRIALIASCLYCAHPINAMLVNYKTASMLSLFVIFLQLSTLTFLKYLNNKRTIFFLLSLLFFFFGLLTHEMSAIMPAVIFFILFSLKELPLKKCFIFSIYYAFVLGLYLCIRNSIPNLRPVDTLLHMQIHFTHYVGTITPLILWYLSKLIIPDKIIFLLDTTIIKHPTLVLIGNMVFGSLLGTALYYIFLKWKKGPKAFALALFATGFIPFCIASFTYTLLCNTVIIEPHWFSYPSIGFFVLIAYFLISIKKFLKNKLWLLLIILCVTSLSAWTRINNTYWQDEKTYCTYWLTVNPLDETAKRGLAHAYIISHNKGLNKNAYKDSTEIFKLVDAFYQLGLPHTAEQYYKMGLEVQKTTNRNLPFAR